jgi:NADH:ubiquinone reductase (H+-translocating)
MFDRFAGLSRRTHGRIERAMMRNMSPLRRAGRAMARGQHLLAGAAAGLTGGVVLAWTTHTQGYMPAVAAAMGLHQASGSVPLFLVAATLMGVGFAAIFRYQPDSYAAMISGGMLYGLLWWIVGPLTLQPLLTGTSLTWSLAQADAAFPSLIGHLLYGGVTGFSFYVLMTLYGRGGPVTLPVTTKGPRWRIVILGGGFGGVSTAQRLGELFSRDQSIDVTLVSQSNYLLFTPMLAEVASSGLEAQHISTPVRAALPRARFRRAEIEEIDTANQMVRIRTSDTAPIEKLPYDDLVLALGAVPSFHGLPGLETYAFTLKSLADAVRLRNHVIAQLERADVETDPEERRRQLTFVVAGGGFAGTEMIAELFDLVHSVLRYYPQVRRGELRFFLVHSGERILPELSEDLSAYARRKLELRGLTFCLGRRVTQLSAEQVELDDGSRLETRTLVWTAGNRPNPLLAGLPWERNRAGALVVERTLQVKTCSQVWAIGDCAQIPDPDRQGAFCPPTAQHALREGRVAAENIAARLQGLSPRPFRFRTIGTLVALGHRTAVADVRGWKFSGLLAWFLWRTIYLSKLPGLEKKVRVALDWGIDLFFPRDIVLTTDTSPTQPVTNAIRPTSPSNDVKVPLPQQHG